MTTVAYDFLADAAYLRTAVRRGNRRGRLIAIALIAFWSVCGLLVLLFAGVLIADREWRKAELIVIFGAAILVPLVGYRKIEQRRQWARDPGFGRRLRVTLAEEGVHVFAEGVLDSRENWRMYRCARLLPDGIVLFYSAGGWRWLPDSALVEGSRAQIDSILSHSSVESF